MTKNNGLTKEKCENCGYDKSKPALHIHHILDSNYRRTGEEIVLCANCHTEEHWGINDNPKNHFTKKEIGEICPICTKGLLGVDMNICFDCYVDVREEVFRQLSKEYFDREDDSLEFYYELPELTELIIREIFLR